MTDLDTIPRPAPVAWRRRALETAGHILPPLLLLVLVLAFHPFREVVTFDPDEGNNLMKARLVADGHALYSEIWSDQPALFTWMLCAWLDVTSWSVEAGRLLVLLCSCVLVWALYQVVRQAAGHAGAIASCVLLVMSAGYLRLSVSVMLAVPSLMFALLSLWAVLRYRRDGRAAWPALAGVFLALALGVKLWTAMLIPVLALAVLLAARAPAATDAAPRAWRRPLAWWTVGFAATVIALFLATVPLGEIGQLLRPHLDVRGARDFHVHTMAFWGHFLEDLAIVLLAVPGLIFVIQRKNPMAAVLALWAVLATVVLAGHEPLWYHHYLMVSVPLCGLAGIAVAGMPAVIRSGAFISWQGRRTVLAWGTTLPAGAAAVLLAVQAPDFFRANFAARSSLDLLRDRHLVELMTRLPGDTHCVMTDRQILPFRAGLRVPPELCVTSLKRRWAGHLSDDRLIALLAAYEPEQVYLSGQRLRLTAQLYDWLGPRYRHVYGDPWGGLFLVRNDLAPTAMTGLVEAAGAYENCWEAQLNLGPGAGPPAPGAVESPCASVRG
ncbi:MAG: ArnT family glycosyltransferase [Planctomycetota bacterium]|jgi:hypothetical protein